jgi:hypothetical protein
MNARPARRRGVLWWLGTAGFGLGTLQGMAILLLFVLARLGCGPFAKPADGSLRRTHADMGNYWADYSKTPNFRDELPGTHLQDLGPGDKEGCLAEWTDEDETFLVGKGPSHGQQIEIWRTLTLQGKAIQGQYLADLWTATPPGPGALGLGRADTDVMTRNHRLVQRVPAALGAPAGFRAILPGECVLGSLVEDNERVVGRYWIELPAKMHVKVALSKLTPLPVALEAHVAFEHAEMPQMPQHGGYAALGPKYFEPQQRGPYRVTIFRIDTPNSVSPGSIRGQNYTLEIYWGTRRSSDCSRPDIEQRRCF